MICWEDICSHFFASVISSREYVGFELKYTFTGSIQKQIIHPTLYVCTTGEIRTLTESNRSVRIFLIIALKCHRVTRWLNQEITFSSLLCLTFNRIIRFVLFADLVGETNPLRYMRLRIQTDWWRNIRMKLYRRLTAMRKCPFETIFYIKINRNKPKSHYSHY